MSIQVTFLKDMNKTFMVKNNEWVSLIVLNYNLFWKKRAFLKVESCCRNPYYVVICLHVVLPNLNYNTFKEETTADKDKEKRQRQKHRFGIE